MQRHKSSTIYQMWLLNKFICKLMSSFTWHVTCFIELVDRRMQKVNKDDFLRIGKMVEFFSFSKIHICNTYLLTYLLTPWCRVLLEKLTGLQLVKKFPAFHGTRRFITALTSVRHLSLSWASPIQSLYTNPTSWRSILILSAHLRPGLPSGLLPSGFPTKNLYTPLSSPIRATCPAHLILLDLTLSIINQLVFIAKTIL